MIFLQVNWTLCDEFIKRRFFLKIHFWSEDINFRFKSLFGRLLKDDLMQRNVNFSDDRPLSEDVRDTKLLHWRHLLFQRNVYFLFVKFSISSFFHIFCWNFLQEFKHIYVQVRNVKILLRRHLKNSLHFTTDVSIHTGRKTFLLSRQQASSYYYYY